MELTTDMSYDELQITVDQFIRQKLRETCQEVSASKLGLDYRCGIVYVDLDEQAVIIPATQKKVLEYYGGFEYVKHEDVLLLGQYVVYRGDRVTRHLDQFENSDQ